MNILMGEIRIGDDEDRKDFEALGVYAVHKTTKAKTSKQNARLEIYLPDDWAKEIMWHLLHPNNPVKFPRAKHNYLLMRIPIGEDK